MIRSGGLIVVMFLTVVLGRALVSTVIAGAIGVRPQKTVPRTLGVRSSEERPDLAAPRHQRELVDGRDHHRRRPMIDFLVDDQDRNAGMRLLARFALREFAAPLLVAAVDRRPSCRRIDFDVVLRRYLAAAPRTAGQLRRRCATGIELFRVANVLNCPVAVLGRARRDLVADP